MYQVRRYVAAARAPPTYPDRRHRCQADLDPQHCVHEPAIYTTIIIVIIIVIGGHLPGRQISERETRTSEITNTGIDNDQKCCGRKN